MEADTVQTQIVEWVDDHSGYFKSWEVAEDLGISPKRAGQNIQRLESSGEIEVQRWGSGNRSTTWFTP